MNTTQTMARMLITAKEAQMRKMISELSPAYLSMIGLGTQAAIDAHVAAAMAEDAEALGL